MIETGPPGLMPWYNRVVLNSTFQTLSLQVPDCGILFSLVPVHCECKPLKTGLDRLNILHVDGKKDMQTGRLIESFFYITYIAPSFS